MGLVSFNCFRGVNQSSARVETLRPDGNYEAVENICISINNLGPPDYGKMNSWVPLLRFYKIKCLSQWFVLSDPLLV